MKQRVCMVSFDYPPLEGGISRLCAAIVDDLLLRNHPVEVISRQTSAAQVAFQAPKTPEYRVPAKRFKADWQLFKRLRKYHRDDIVITGVWYPEALIAWFAGCRHIAVLAHGNDIMHGQPTLKNRLLSWARKHVFKRAKIVIANSHYTGNLVKAQTDTPVAVATLGVDEQRFTPRSDEEVARIRERLGFPKDSFIALTTSRIQAYKGHDIVLAAIRDLPVESREKMRYVIAGRGEHLANLKAMAEDYGVMPQVMFLGFVDETDLADLYACVDAFVMCTREESGAKQVEGFGLVFLEAQASGTLAIGTRQGGIVDAIDDQNGGFLIDRDDVVALSARLGDLIDHPEKVQQQSELARQRVEQSTTWRHYGDRVNQILEQYFGHS